MQTPRTSHYQALYEDALQRAVKAKELAEWLPPELYTFQPHVLPQKQRAGQPLNLTPSHGKVSERCVPSAFCLPATAVKGAEMIISGSEKAWGMRERMH